MNLETVFGDWWEIRNHTLDIENLIFLDLMINAEHWENVETTQGVVKIETELNFMKK